MLCPRCGAASPGYDSRSRRWRHLGTCQYKTILGADVPREKCKEHGVVTVDAPWAEPGSGYTALFEALVIDWLHEASVNGVSRQMKLSWNAIDGIMKRAIKRGLLRCKTLQLKHLDINETSLKKRHDYVTVISDPGTGHVGQGRTKADLKAWYESLEPEQLESIESVAMDMWPLFINATLESVPGVQDKIAFDKFHVAKYLGDAVDKVRRAEHKALLAEGRTELSGSKYQWQTNPENMSPKQWRAFQGLRESALKTARAWAIKELAMSLWHYVSKTWAKKNGRNGSPGPYAAASPRSKRLPGPSSPTSGAFSMPLCWGSVTDRLKASIVGSSQSKSGAAASVTRSASPMPSTFTWADWPSIQRASHDS